MLYVGAPGGMRNMGAYSATVPYFPNDVVTYAGSTYMATSLTVGKLPTNTTYWQILAAGFGSSVPSDAINASRSESNIYGLAAQTTAATAKTLTMDGTGTVDISSEPNVLIVPAFSNYMFSLQLTARRAGVTVVSQGWTFHGMIARDAGNVRLVGSITQVSQCNEGSSLGTVGFAANTTGQYLAVTVTPSAATATIWNARLTTNELTLAS